MDKRSILQLIEHAFTPAKEIELPELFSGRRDEILRGVLAMRSPGASLCIHGMRGVGKTSIAKQLSLIAAGNPVLLDLLKKPELFDPNLFCLPTIFFSCDDTIANAEGLFRKLLSDRDSLSGICRFNNGTILQRVKQRHTESAKLTSHLLEASETSETEIENVVAELDPVAAFKSVTGEIADTTGKNHVLVVIDEFERVCDKVGIASIIRTSPAAKFVMVGIAEDIKKLIADHESVARQLAEGTIVIRPMDLKSLIEIIRRGEVTFGGHLVFDDAVIRRIASLASGFPHWVHLLAKYSAISATERGSSRTELVDLNQALNDLVSRRLEPEYEDRYLSVASGSVAKELVLRVFAYDRSEEHNVKRLYQQLADLGVRRETAAVYVGILAKSGVLRRVRRGFYRFEKPLFKAYCAIRPPVYPEGRKTNVLLRSRTREVNSTMIKFNLDDAVLEHLSATFRVFQGQLSQGVLFKNKLKIDN